MELYQKSIGTPSELRTNYPVEGIIPPTGLRTEPLFIPPALEPVAFSLPNSQRKTEIETFLYEIGEEDRTREIWQEVKYFNPLEVPHLPRQGYTPEQVRWVKYKRDNGIDQAMFPHIESVEQLRTLGLYTRSLAEMLRKVELHHIIPQSYCQAFLGLANHPELINHPANGLTLAKIDHSSALIIPGINEPRHPDVGIAGKYYGELPSIISMVLANHWDVAKQGGKFWVSDYDTQMHERALENTNSMYEKAGRR